MQRPLVFTLENEVDLSGVTRGKPTSFYLATTQGRSREIETRVTSVARVKTSELSEYGYVVPLFMKCNDSGKTVIVTLNESNRMKYRLLLGRNELRGEF